MDLDHENHPLAMADWSQYSNHMFYNSSYINTLTISLQKKPGTTGIKSSIGLWPMMALNL